MRMPPGKQPWQRLVLMSGHEGLLPASPPLKSLLLAAAQGTQGLFLWAGAAWLRTQVTAVEVSSPACITRVTAV